ncbi:GOLPH3/VPS74 family protein [Nonomuraea typhae]|uniref:GOLPH3/VPS74 family protein n=1 Tax=Nonomuraea typhae TaxID=2603600 RepID=UPI0012F77251|nr:GPP34 family phosphoprotein [Nonomuraea typhae]
MTLSIAEEFVLLAYGDDDGKPLVKEERVKLVLVAALLSELALDGRVELDEDGGVAVADATPTGDRALDEVLAAIAEVGSTLEPHRWFVRLHARQEPVRVLESLAEAGALRVDRRRSFGVFASTRYPQGDPGFELEIRSRIQAGLDGAEAGGRTAAVLALVHAAKLTGRLFPGADAARVEELVAGDWVGRALLDYYGRGDRGNVVETAFNTVFGDGSP